MDSERALLSVADYILFGLMLLVSAGIGVYIRFSGGSQKTTDDYLLAGKNMPVLPVAFSIMASSLSAITFIGTPAEVYLFGIHTFHTCWGYLLGILVVSYVCLPVFFNLGACTAYEYLEKRFGKMTRIFTSVVFLMQTMLYMSVVLYAPALALSAVTDMSKWTSVMSVGAVCTFYCTLGGMKAVLWTDLFQALLMFFGVIAILTKAFLDVGFVEVFRIGYEDGRIAVAGFGLNLTERYTVWNLLFQGFTWGLMNFGANQVQIQRLSTLKNISRSRMALYLSIPLHILFSGLTCIVGLVIYAHFYNCDPLTAPHKPISAADKLLPYYVITVLGAYPGLSGLCICGVFSAALSTVSSAMNSLSAVTIQDIVKPALGSRKYSERTMTLTAKALTLFYGMFCILTTVVAESFGNLIQAAVTIWGMCGGPVLAVFLLGMLTTRSNEKGALIGLLTSLFLTAWVSFGKSTNGPRPQILPLSTSSCPANATLFNETEYFNFNATEMSLVSETSTFSTTSLTDNNAETSYVFPLYRISHMWYAPLGLLVGLIVGYISSIIISRITGEYPDIEEEFLSPVLTQFSKKKKLYKEKEMDFQGQEEAEYLTSGTSNNNSRV